MSAARPASGLFADPRPIEALGDLFANIWQLCYVTPDLDLGMKELGDVYGIENSTEVPVDGATFMKRGEQVEWKPRVAMGARGGLIVELIEPVAGEVGFYRDALAKDGGALGFHHVAMLVPLGDEA
jgi:hypothetical protein